MNIRKFWKQYEIQVQRVVDAARLVAVFDGTDRDSLDTLRNELYRLGELQVEYERMHESPE